MIRRALPFLFLASMLGTSPGAPLPSLALLSPSGLGPMDVSAEAEADAVAAGLRLGATQAGVFLVLTEEEARQALGEHASLPRDCFAERCAVNAARRLGTDLVLASRYVRHDSVLELGLALLSRSTGRAVTAVRRQEAVPSGGLIAFAQAAALALAEEFTSRRPAPATWKDMPWLNSKDTADHRRAWKWTGSGVLLAAFGLAYAQGQLLQEDANRTTAPEKMLQRGGAVSFLRGFFAAPNLGARYAAQGGAGIARVNDAQALLMNPAGVAGARESGMAAKRTLPGGAPSFFLAYAGPLYGQWFQGLGVLHEGDGLASETTLQGAVGYDGGGWGRTWAGIKAGANLKLYLAQVGESGTGEDRSTGHSYGLGLDLGLQARLSGKITGALVVRDAAGFVRHANTFTNRAYGEILPPEYRIGAAYRALPSLSLCIDGQKGMYADQVDHVRLGGEQRVLGFLFIRGGLHQVFGKEAVRKVGLGFGLDSEGLDGALRGSRVALNYSYEFGLDEDEPLGGGQQFSLEASF